MTVNLMGAWSKRWDGALVRSDWLLGCRLRGGGYTYTTCCFYFDEGVGKHYTVIHMDMCETSYDYYRIERLNSLSALFSLLML